MVVPECAAHAPSGTRRPEGSGPLRKPTSLAVSPVPRVTAPLGLDYGRVGFLATLRLCFLLPRARARCAVGCLEPIPPPVSFIGGSYIVHLRLHASWTPGWAGDLVLASEGPDLPATLIGLEDTPDEAEPVERTPGHWLDVNFFFFSIEALSLQDEEAQKGHWPAFATRFRQLARL